MYDYIIVGGGSSGCVLASRLSEMTDAKVLLLEAGPRDRNPYIHIPVGFFKMTGGPLTWGLTTAPQRHVNNREIPFAQARVIGGGGSINAEVFTRGAREDYDRWAEAEGCSGWTYDEVMPYFKKSEDNDTLADGYHGVGGPLGVSNPISPNRMSKVFVQACQQAGLPYNPDFNGKKQDGCGLYQTTTRGAKRCSAAVGYLNDARQRRNLDIWDGCVSTRILIENGRAVGVEFQRKGKVEQVRASQEVIVASGAIGSPKLLMLSGVGPADHLRSLGIDVHADLAGVGQNLQDHFGTDVIYELNGQYSFDKYAKPHWMLWAGLEYLLFKKGPVASNIVEGGAFWYADKSSDTVDTQFHFLSGAGVEEGIPDVQSGAGVTMNSYFLRPRSRGAVSLNSADPSDSPIVDPNYLADPYDLRMSVEGVKQMREIMAQSAFSKYIRGEHMPGGHVRTDKDYENYIRQYGRTCYHPVGTCKMGLDDMSVVDPELRVRGVEGLRVVDSSVMPSLVSSNTNAPTIMIAEKASDLIRSSF
ncbi:GMC family oxidoreductase [Nitrincola sp.]|uniref:GMC family oxidoreductase n=1 Tax=Nitrincola sp. TaxID=1926584 RepID=UPI003A8D8CCE